MWRSVPRVVALAVVLTVGCRARPVVAPAGPAARPAHLSGFLDDYTQLVAGGPGEPKLVYRAADAPWHTYERVIIEPVTLWRSGERALDPVPEEDLRRIVSTFEHAVRRRLGEGFPVVDAPGPGVLRLRLAITEARATDPVLDVLTARAEEPGAGWSSADVLHPETLRFLDRATIEGELRDTATDRLLAALIDYRGEDAPTLRVWGDLERGLERWADRACARLEARTGRR